MNEIVKEWIQKAEGDWRTANREFGVDDDPNFDAVCFHAQQCIEKLQKAALIACNTIPPKTHDLAELNGRLSSVVGDWECNIRDLRYLTRAAVEYRYPGESADHEEAAQAIQICNRVRRQLLDMLNREFSE